MGESYLINPEYAYRGMRVVCFANEKGGVAKTTSCVNIAAALARKGKSILCIDMDAQANATLALGLDADTPETEWETFSLLTDMHLALERVIFPTMIENLDIVPADRQLSNAEKMLISEVARETRLRSKLKDFARSAFTKHYDVVLIDCPPSLDLVTLNVLVASTDMIVPVQPKLYSLKGMARLGETVATIHSQLNVQLKLLGVLVCMYDKTASLDVTVHKLLRDKVTREYGDFVFRAAIAKSVAVSEAETDGKPVVLHSPESPAARAYEQVADELLERLERTQNMYG